MIKSYMRPFQKSVPRVQTVGGSPYTYVNATGYLQMMSINGGLLVSLSLLGISLLGGTSTTIVRPGDTVTITYTTAPTVTVTDLF